MQKIRIGMMTALLLLGCACGARSAPVDAPASEPHVNTYAFVTKAEGNPYNDCTAEGYREVIEAAGEICLIVNPREATAEAQISLIREMVDKEVDSITVAANDADALQESLQEAMDAGIVVTSMDSSTNPASRKTFVNQTTTEDVAQVLVDAVYELSGGAGQWAILSATSQAANQNAWIDAMKKVLQNEKYKKLRLVDIVYGNDESEASAAATQRLLDQYPNLKVICSPTAVGLPAAAAAVQRAKSSVKVTGLGLPSEMAAYISDDETAVCPYAYLWNPLDLGRLSAYVSQALLRGDITGAAGEQFTAGSMGQYTIRQAADGGTEVILALPLCINSTNINALKQLF
ncbi:MAG: substrate-binding domain-containing protein [Ruthenibacterium sp.]